MIAEAVRAPSFGRALLLALVALVLQTSVLHLVSWRGAVVSPVLVIVVWFAANGGLGRAMLFGAIVGGVEDAISGGTGGAWTIATTTVAALCALLARSFAATESPPLLVALVALMTIVRELAFWGAMRAAGYPSGLGAIHVHVAVVRALLDAGLAVLIAPLLAEWLTGRRSAHR